MFFRRWCVAYDARRHYPASITALPDLQPPLSYPWANLQNVTGVNVDEPAELSGLLKGLSPIYQ